MHSASRPHSELTKMWWSTVTFIVRLHNPFCLVSKLKNDQRSKFNVIRTQEPKRGCVHDCVWSDVDADLGCAPWSCADHVIQPQFWICGFFTATFVFDTSQFTTNVSKLLVRYWLFWIVCLIVGLLRNLALIQFTFGAGAEMERDFFFSYYLSHCWWDWCFGSIEGYPAAPVLTPHC